MFFRQNPSNESLEWYIFVGLGNPGREYEHTRHNIGFFRDPAISRALVYRYQPLQVQSIDRRGYGCGGNVVALVMPQTYMNLSGTAVGFVCAFL